MSPIQILLVEDNEGDIILTFEAFKDASITNTISVTRNGEEAINFLNKEGVYVRAQTPDLVLLDINLPRIDGKQVLSYIKTHRQLKTVPVVILTTSTAEKDIEESYINHANCYISKPGNIDQFFDVVKKIENFWISIVHLPKHKS